MGRQVCLTMPTRIHHSNQPHALTMLHEPILALVLWRGDGMDGLPLMGAK